VCAVVAGARSFVAIAEWPADLPVDVAATLGISAAPPSESAVRRLVGRLDPDRFDNAIGAWVQQLCADVAPAGRRRVLAVDGKTLRGSRTTTDGSAAGLPVWRPSPGDSSRPRPRPRCAADGAGQDAAASRYVDVGAVSVQVGRDLDSGSHEYVRLADQEHQASWVP
jgi:hypothetical protein